MRNALFLSMVGLVLGFLAPSAARGDTNVGLSFDSDGIKGFYLAIGDYFNVPEKEVVVARERKIPDEEIPVLFYLARRADVQPKVILDMRLAGKGWMEIVLRYGLSPEIFYVALKEDPGPPYGRAYGYYKNRKRAEWSHIVLKDVDIVNLVNLRFLSEHYKYRPEDVIRMRAQGNNFVAVNKEIYKAKHPQRAESQAQPKKENSKGNEKGKGKGKDK